MFSYFQWLPMHSNWVIGVLWLLLGTFFLCHDMKGKRLKFAAIGLLVGCVPAFFFTYVGYNDYRNHYTTCSKPAAVAAMYVFDAEKERCYRPFVGYVPVNQKGVLETQSQKEKPAPVKYQLVTVNQGDNNV